MAVGDITSQLETRSQYKCNDFDGVDDYVEIPHNAAQLGANLSNGFTISAWINPRGVGETAGSDAGRILDKSSGDAGTNGFHYCLESTNNRIRFRLNGGTVKTSANNSISFGVWTYVLVTIKSNQLCSHYINGNLSSTADGDLVQTISTITTTNAPRIANEANTTTRTFNGAIRDVKMWNRVLTTTEITEEYAGKHHSDGCIHFFKLGGDYTDYGNVGVTATNSGSTAVTDLTSGITTDMKGMNLPTVTDKIIVLPVSGRDRKVRIIKAERAAA